MIRLLAVLGFKLLCKGRVLNVQSTAAEPIMGLHFFGISRKSDKHRNSARILKRNITFYIFENLLNFWGFLISLEIAKILTPFLDEILQF